jgi:integrase
MTNYPSLTKFHEFVQLKDLRPTTRAEYLWFVKTLAKHFQCDPAQLQEDQIRAYFLHLRGEKKYAPSSMTIAKAALLLFFQECLGIKGWTVFAELRIARPEVLPRVLSRQEVRTLLGAVQQPRYATCLRLIYHTGLRVGEAVGLQVTDIRAHQPTPHLHIRNGKGGQDRFVPLSPSMIGELRAWWKTHRHPRYLFPAVPPPSQQHSPTKPLSTTSVQVAFRLARSTAGIDPAATIHCLRHSYATHLLEEGISLRQISAYLGHHSIKTTVRYTHLTAISEARTRAALQTLYHRISH